MRQICETCQLTISHQSAVEFVDVVSSALQSLPDARSCPRGPPKAQSQRVGPLTIVIRLVRDSNPSSICLFEPTSFMAVGAVRASQAGVCESLAPSSPLARSTSVSPVPSASVHVSAQASAVSAGGSRSSTLYRKTESPLRGLTVPNTCLALSRPARRKKLGGGGGPWDGGSGGGGGRDGGEGRDDWSDDWRPAPAPLAVLWSLVCAFAVTHSTAYLLSVAATALTVSGGAWRDGQAAGERESAALESDSGLGAAVV